MEQLEGFVKFDRQHKICKMKKVLFGLNSHPKHGTRDLIFTLKHAGLFNVIN
jgi:hypothetical protein